MSIQLLVLLLQALDVANAAALVSPRQTTSADDVNGLEDGWTPKPTSPPRAYPAFGFMPQGQLFARQTIDAETCGFYYGAASLPITCATGVCVYYNTADPPGFLCCGSVSGSLEVNQCPYTSSCLNYKETGNSYSGSGVVMASDDGIISCGTAYPSCFTVANSDSTGGTWFSYGCDTASGYYSASLYVTSGSASGPASASAPQSSSHAQSSSSKQSSSQRPSSTQPSVSSSSSSSAQQPRSSSNPPSTSSSNPRQSSSSPSQASSSQHHSVLVPPPVITQDTQASQPPKGTRTHHGGGGGLQPATQADLSTSSGTAKQTGNGGEGSSTNVGAIAGGTVGGVAAVALVGSAIGYLIFRKKKQRVQPMPEVSQYNVYSHNY